MIKVVDGFCWLVVNEKCAEIFSSGLFELFKLHSNGSESLIETIEELNEARVSGFDIAIEVGQLP